MVLFGRLWGAKLLLQGPEGGWANGRVKMASGVTLNPRAALMRGTITGKTGT